MKATQPAYSPRPVPLKLTAWCQWRIIQGPHTTNVNDLSQLGQLGIDVPHAAHLRTCQARHVFESWHWRDELEIGPFHRDRIALLSGYQTAESHLQNFVVVYVDPLHKEQVVWFGRDMTAWLSKHVATSHTKIQTKMADKLDMFSNLGIGEMSLKLCPSTATELPCFQGTKSQSHICRISLLSTSTRSTKNKLFDLDVIWPHDSQSMWPRPTQRFKPKWLTRCKKKFWKGARKHQVNPASELNTCPLHCGRWGRGGLYVTTATSMVQFAVVIPPGCTHTQEAVALLDSITHNRPSPTVCNNLRLCNTDTPSAFHSYLQASSYTILYKCSIRLTISCFFLAIR